jgi:hypothetical protein
LLPLDLCYEIFSLLTIDEAIKFSKAFPRTFGAYIESKQVIRFNNAINSAPSPLFNRVLSGTEDKSSSFRSWLKPRLLKSCIVPPLKLFPQLSSIIASNYRFSLFFYRFSTASSSLSNWDVSLKDKYDEVCSVSWKLIYRASLFGSDARDFHQACDGMGKCVVVVRAENGRIAAAYNGDGFSSSASGWNERLFNRNGFIVSIEEDGSFGAKFDKTLRGWGIFNSAAAGPCLGSGLSISSNCDKNERSYCRLGEESYGNREGKFALFGQEHFRVSDYEVFKIEIYK